MIFLSVLFDFLHIHKHVILVLVEIKVHSSAANVNVQNSHFYKVVTAEDISFSNGIWVFLG